MAAASLVALSSAASAQGMGPLTTVGGTVVDLSVDSSGDLVYCTTERDVGRITTAGAVTVLATAATGPFSQELRAVVETPAGDVAVVDKVGDIWKLPGGATPAVQVYSDLFLVKDPTDMIVDASGNFVVASDTATSGIRAVDWISPDGSRWAYYLVQHTPLALAADPLGPNLVLADETGGGALRLIDASDAAHPTQPLDTLTLPGFSEAGLDGDLACEIDGDVLTIAGGTLWRFDRVGGGSTPLVSGLGQLRALAIAASSGGVTSNTGWSAYLAEGSAPTTIVELGGVDPPASVIPASLGTVPGRGTLVQFFATMNVYELAVDANGDLLVGGDFFGGNARVDRIDVDTLAVSTVAGPADGITGRIEGIACGADGTIWAVSSSGTIHRITEGPLSVSTPYTDPLDLVTTAKDLLLDRDGNLYVANRAGWSTGDVLRVDPQGNPTSIVSTDETRGLAADPFGPGILVAEWFDTGFEGAIGRLDTQAGTIDPLPGFVGMNYTNAPSWGDGDIVVDVEGQVYTCSEDDFSVHRYDLATGKLVRIASGYTKHPSGLTIARSTPGSGSTTGWSLYVSEFINLWEIPSVPAPAPTIADPGAPPVGRLVGWLPASSGKARDLLPDPGGPAGDGLIVSTSEARLEHVETATGSVTTLATPAQGLSGDLTALGVTGGGNLYVAKRTGTIFAVSAAMGYTAFPVFTDPLGQLDDVRGLAIDGVPRLIVSERPTGSTARGELYRLDGPSLGLLTYTHRGARPAIDPLTGEIFVTEQGSIYEGAGEILRVDPTLSPVMAGHHDTGIYTTFEVGDLDGGIAFDADGNLYVAAGDLGRVTRVDRATGARQDVAAGFTHPVALALAPGTPGTAGGDGTSLFVLDGSAVWEIGVEGLPAPAPPASPPGLAPRTDLLAAGEAVFGGTTPVSVESPADAGKIYAILPTIFGKLPGFPVGSLGDPSDTRVIPNNYSFMWEFVSVPAVMPGFIGILDPMGKSAPGTGMNIPADPVLMGLDLFVDLAWFSWDASAQNGIQTIGGTAQILLGD